MQKYQKITHKINTRFPKLILIIFIIFWIFLAISPHYREIWFFENILSVILVFMLILTYQKFRFSNISYWLIFLLLCSQTIGAHYTYAEVPIGFYIQNMFDLSRNHYDRFVHFLFGLLLTLPIKEVCEKYMRTANTKFLYIILVLIIFGVSGLYEVLEWIYAIFRESGSSENKFLGAQGDFWDAQKDIFLAALGAIIFLAIYHLLTQRKI